MKMEPEQFKVETLKLMMNKLDYVYSMAKRYHNDNPELMDTIEGLATIANMFTKMKIEELNGNGEKPNSQGYIVSKLGNSYSRMKEYEKKKDINFPTWKL